MNWVDNNLREAGKSPEHCLESEKKKKKCHFDHLPYHMALLPVSLWVQMSPFYEDTSHLIFCPYFTSLPLQKSSLKMLYARNSIMSERYCESRCFKQIKRFQMSYSEEPGVRAFMHLLRGVGFGETQLILHFLPTCLQCPVISHSLQGQSKAPCSSHTWFLLPLSPSSPLSYWLFFRSALALEATSTRSLLSATPSLYLCSWAPCV